MFLFITSATEVMFLPVSVCWLVGVWAQNRPSYLLVQIRMKGWIQEFPLTFFSIVR